jgi:peptidoglycan L-alanyl-D-glutamate endopeptidase CwlK
VADASPYFIGDSIAEGLKTAAGGQGDTKVGRSPAQVLQAIQNAPSLSGRKIVLSTGLSNNPADMSSVSQQFQALRAKGVNPSDISVVGLGSRFNNLNPTLGNLVSQQGANFSGGFQAGADGVHPASYGTTLHSVFSPSPQGASSGAPTTNAPASGNYGPNNVYSNIPPLDSRGENQIAKFTYWNPDPIGTSNARLAQVHPDMQAIVNKARADNPNLNFVVGSGVRSQADQQNAYKWGWSTVNPNTTRDVNQQGVAVDLWPLDANGKPTFDPQAMATVGSAMKTAASQLGTPITWGGDWSTFKDRSHFQLNNPSPGYTPPAPLPSGPQPNISGSTAPPPAPGTAAVSGGGAWNAPPVAASSSSPPPGTAINSNILDTLGRNIAGIESGGWRNPYAAAGPQLGATASHPAGQALGKYQVMSYNVGPWTQQALGHAETPDQFRADPAAQEAVFRDQMTRTLASNSPADAASIWFTGKPLSQAGGAAKDVLGTTNASYIARATAGIPNASTTLNSNLLAAQNAPVSTTPGNASAGASGSNASTAATAAAGALGTPAGPALPGMSQQQSTGFLQGASSLDKALGGQGLGGQSGDGQSGGGDMKPSPIIQGAPPHIPNPAQAAQTFGQTLNSMRTPPQWGPNPVGAPIYATAGQQGPEINPEAQQMLQQLQMQQQMQMMGGGMGTSLNSYGGFGYG